MDDALRDFEYGPVVGAFTRSYARANDECRRLGFRYAAIQNGRQLFCNHEYPSYPQANPKDCEQVKCKDEPKFACGGAWRQIVFRAMSPQLGLTDCDAKYGVIMLGPQQSSFSLSGPVKGWSMRATSRHPQVVISSQRHAANPKPNHNPDADRNHNHNPNPDKRRLWSPPTTC